MNIGIIGSAMEPYRHLFKVSNSILATSLKDMGRAKGEKNRIAIAVSGDNTKAKEVVFIKKKGRYHGNRVGLICVT